MMEYLWRMLKDFGAHAEALTSALLKACLEAAERYDRPVKSLPSCSLGQQQPRGLAYGSPCGTEHDLAPCHAAASRDLLPSDLAHSGA